MEIRLANIFPATSPVRDKNIVDVMSLGLPQSLRGVITPGTWTVLWASRRYSFFQFLFQVPPQQALF